MWPASPATWHHAHYSTYDPTAMRTLRLAALSLSMKAWIVVVAAMCGCSATLAATRWMPRVGRPIAGLFVAAQIPPSNLSLRDWLEQRRTRLALSSIRLTHGMDAFDLSLSELGIEVDVNQTMQAALAKGRSGPLSARLRDILQAREGRIDVPFAFRIDSTRAQSILGQIDPMVRREPLDARFDLTAHEKVAHVDGEEIDFDSTINGILRGIGDHHDSFPLTMRSVHPRVTLDSLSAIDISKVVGTYETGFHLWGDGAGRAVNIATAARSLDGAVLMPAQTLSFNHRVGPRTRSRGYTDAPEVVGDELQPGVGGGACQVASTVYAAALFSALTIDERWAHGRPSSYTKLGLDATVAYPSKDLRFTNSLPYPIMLHVFLPKQDTVRAEILGGQPVAQVQYQTGIAKTEPFHRRITRKRFLPSGTAHRHQKGIRGYSVFSMVRIQYNDGHTTQRGYSSEYRPTPEVFWISDDYDETRLPSLPEGAASTESALASPQNTSG